MTLLLRAVCLSDSAPTEAQARRISACVLIAGIQPKEDIVDECRKLTDIGVIPTIIPFKAMDDCQFRYKNNCRPEELIWISSRVGVLLKDKSLSPEMQEGCTKCGGCSLETNYYSLV